MNKLQLQALIDACPDEFDVYIEGADEDYDIHKVELDYDNGILVLKTYNDEVEEEEEEEEQEDALWNTPDSGPVCGMERPLTDESPSLPPNLVEV